MKEEFNKIFANLPIPLRSEIIYVDDKYGVMSWNVVKLEIDASTEIGKKAFETLKEMKII